MVGGFGEYVVYVDEAGDHGRVSPEFPVFVLAFCIFKKSDYAAAVLPAVHELKFRYFGHDAVVLHEREIRKALAPFEFLRVPERREAFMAELTGAFDAYCRPSGSLAGCNLALVFASKAQNHGGMQLADMVARPIGRHRIDAHGQPNRAYATLRQKFWSSERQGLLLLPVVDGLDRSVA